MVLRLNKDLFIEAAGGPLLVYFTTVYHKTLTKNNKSPASLWFSKSTNSQPRYHNVILII